MPLRAVARKGESYGKGEVVFVLGRTFRFLYEKSPLLRGGKSGSLSYAPCSGSLIYFLRGVGYFYLSELRCRINLGRGARKVLGKMGDERFVFFQFYRGNLADGKGRDTRFY